MSKLPLRQPSVTALSRGLSILRCFDRPRAELTVSQIARRTGLSQPTAWRLCQTLVEDGFLVRTAQASLRVGAPALTLGFAAIQGLGFPEIALPYLRRIAEQTRATTTLSLRQGSEMVSIERCDGDVIAPNEPIGWRAPLFVLSSGLAVLARMSEPERRDALQVWTRAHPDTHARERIKEASTQLATAGYVRLEGMLQGEFAAVAVPLVQPAAIPAYWAISCGGVRAMWDADRFAAAGAALAAIVPLLEPALAALPPSAAG
ncbi:MAG: helix-turn-helix domain-containing protein [Sphingomonadaceae bacterium]|nr:helix-turn-helix domain-containing protein [Sphingomonadaceae bacterium]